MWLLVVLCVYSTLAQFMMNYGNDWDMYLVPSYVGTQIWGTASHHVLLLSSRKSCLMTSRGKLVHWWGSWEGAGGPGRASRARRRRRRPPVRRPPAPPAGGAGDGGGSAGSARGDGPRRRRGAARSGAGLAAASTGTDRGSGGEAAGLAGIAPPSRVCRERSALCLPSPPRWAFLHRFTNPIRSVLGCCQGLCPFYTYIHRFIISPSPIPVPELSRGGRVLPM